MRRLVTFLSCFAIALTPICVTAQQPELSSQQEQHLLRLIEEGKTLYDEGEFADARERFSEAYEIYPHPDIIYRIALCHERLGEDQQAVEYYRRFLAQAPNAPERARVEKTISVIEARIAKSDIRVLTDPEGASVYINDEANGIAGTTPVSLSVKPGNYKVIVRKDGYEPVVELVTVGSGASVQVRYQLTPLVAEQRPERGTEPSPKKGPPPVTFVALTAIGVGAGIASYVLFAGYSKTQSELDSKPKNEFTRNEYRRLRTRGNIQLGAGIGTAAISLFSLVWAYGVLQSSRAEPTVAVGATWSDGPAVGLTGRF